MFVFTINGKQKSNVVSESIWVNATVTLDGSSAYYAITTISYIAAAELHASSAV